MLPEQLTEEETQALTEQALEYAKKYEVPKVHVYVSIEPVTNERVIGFLKEPSYIQKLSVMDKITANMMFVASDELRSVLTLKEESDPRTYSTSNDCDKYRLGMATRCLAMIEVMKDDFKKK